VKKKRTTYKKFLDGLKELEISEKELNKFWKYVGGFVVGSVDDTPLDIVAHNEDRRLRSIYYSIMGHHLPLQISDDAQEKCICDTDIKYNHILLNWDLWEKEGELDYIIIGSKCCRDFTENGIVVSLPCKKQGCPNFHKNKKVEYCNDCRTDKDRHCKYFNCKNKITQPRLQYCSVYCKKANSNFNKKYHIFNKKYHHYKKFNNI